MAFYNYTNITSFDTFATAANSATSDWFWTFILIGFFVIVFMALGQYRKEKSFATASALSAVGATFLASLSLINPFVIVVFVTLTAIGALLVHYSDS